MSLILYVAYVVAVVIATVYVIIMIGVLARGRSGTSPVMADDSYLYAMATALVAVITGAVLRGGQVELSVLLIGALPFGMAGAALAALGNREAMSQRLRDTAHNTAFVTAIGFPFAVGITGWS